MLDYGQRLLKHSKELERLAKLYATARKKFGETEGEFHIILATKIGEYRKTKKNLGIEMAYLILLAEKPDLADNYKELKKSYNNYKALERLINAQESAIMALQSLMKFNSKQDTFGGQYET